MYRPFFATCALAALAACGGGATSNVVPLSDSGFASADSEIVRGDSFTIPNAVRMIGDGDVLSLAEQDVTFDILAGTDDVAITIDGVTYRLPSVGGGVFELIDGDDIVVVARLGDPLPEAEIIEVFSVIDNRLNASNVVIGFDTDPAEVAARAGTATLTGQIFVTARNGFNDGFGAGDVSLTADFDRNRVSGTFNVSDLDLDASDFAIPDAAFTLNSTPISGNGFAGTISQVSGDLDGTLREAGYAGRFFGQDAPTAGGQISAIVDVDTSDFPTLIEGAFLVTE